MPGSIIKERTGGAVQAPLEAGVGGVADDPHATVFGCALWIFFLF
jgi:hypothetical protein